MRDNYYKFDQKKKKSQKNRTYLLTGIGFLVCVGIMATSAVMYSTVGQESDETGKVSSTDTLLSASSEEASSVAASSEEISSVIPSSAPVSSEAVSSKTVSSESASSAAASSKPVSSKPVSSLPVLSATAENDSADKASSATETPNYRVDQFDFSKPVTASEKVPLSYFNDAALIGDSRAEGLILYTDLKKHITSYAKTSCTSTMVLEGTGKVAAILPKIEAKKGQFKKVYIMIGLNEAHHSVSAVMKKYGTIIDRLKKSQPEAVIYLQTVLPITKFVENNHGYLNMKNIKTFNTNLQKLAVEKKVYLIDPTPMFAASNGYLLPAARASVGNVEGEYHFNREYTNKWLDYLRTHTVQ